jgi:hypothetical protein
MKMLAVGIACFAALVLADWTVSAHKPIAIGGSFGSMDQALEISDIFVSQVVYTELSRDQPQLWLTFEIVEPSEFHFSLGIPVIERLSSFRPWIAVIGPGLPYVELPFAVPDGHGAIVLQGAAPSDELMFHEPFTGTNSWITVEEDLQLQSLGRHNLVSWALPEQADKLWVAVGKREQFGWKDVLGLPSVIKDVRRFHEIPARHPVLSWQTGLVLAAAALASTLALIRASERGG